MVSIARLPTIALTSSEEDTPKKLDFSEKIANCPLFEGVKARSQDYANAELIRVSKDLDTPSHLKALESLMNTNPLEMYKDPLFMHPDIHHFLLLLHLDGKISEIQLGTAYFFISANTHYSSKMVQEALNPEFDAKMPLAVQTRQIPLFNPDGSINEEAKNLILKTIDEEADYSLAFQPYSREQRASSPRIMTKEQVAEWFEKMRELPPSEQHFLVAERPYDALSGENGYYNTILKFQENTEEVFQGLKESFYDGPKVKRPTIVDAVVAANHNIFNYYTSDTGKKMLMVPSLGMVAALREVIAPYSSLRMQPRFSVRNPIASNRNQALKNLREVALRNPYNKMPIEADGFYAPNYTFTTHDLYHTIAAGVIPDSYRSQFIAFGDIFKQYDDPACQKMADMCYDMEAATFRMEKLSTFMMQGNLDQKESEIFAFYLTILGYFEAVHSLMIRESLASKDSSQEERAELLKEKKELFELLLKYIHIRNTDFWYTRTLDPLHRSLSKFPLFKALHEAYNRVIFLPGSIGQTIHFNFSRFVFSTFINKDPSWTKVTMVEEMDPSSHGKATHANTPLGGAMKV